MISLGYITKQLPRAILIAFTDALAVSGLLIGFGLLLANYSPYVEKLLERALVP